MVRDDRAHRRQGPGLAAPFTKTGQKARSPESPTSSQRPSRSPVALTPITGTTARETTRPFPWGHLEDLSWSTTWLALPTYTSYWVSADGARTDLSHRIIPVKRHSLLAQGPSLLWGRLLRRVRIGEIRVKTSSTNPQGGLNWG